MATKRVTITINDQTVELVLRRATVEDGLHRGQLMGKAYEQYSTDETISQAVKIAATILHPVCVGCVREPRAIRDMPLAEFLTLDEEEVNAWAAASYELNPHWVIKVTPPAEAEKKIGTLSTGSDPSMSPDPAPQPAPISPS